MQHIKDKHILLVISGGIAAYKSLELIRLLKAAGAHVQAILTKGGSQFTTPLSISSLTGTKTYTDLWDLTDETEMGHIRLTRTSDLVIIAPASADLMAKLAHGLADDLASTALLANKDTPVMIAPAMNHAMWGNPATQENVRQLKSRGIMFCGPEYGDMACGETGYGRMAEPQKICDSIQSFMQGCSAVPLRPLTGKTAIVTSGPTHEPLDPVRFIGNFSSGKQGHAIAESLRDQGAAVTLITGPTNLPAPHGINVISVKTAQEMHDVVQNALPADIAVCAAAVADWRAQQAAPKKIKKQDGQEEWTITLARNPDILSMLGHLPQSKRPAIVIGFAAETHNMLENARAKLSSKNADIILANAVHSCDSVFGADDNHVYVVDKDDITEWPRADKQDIARKLSELIAQRLNECSPAQPQAAA